MLKRFCLSLRTLKRPDGGKRHTRTVAASGDGDICRYAANMAGQTGLIPQNFVQPIETEQLADEPTAAYENPTNALSEFDMFHGNDYVTLAPAAQVTSPSEPEPNMYENVNYSNDGWLELEQSVASSSTMPVRLLLLRTSTAALHVSLLLAIER